MVLYYIAKMDIFSYFPQFFKNLLLNQMGMFLGNLWVNKVLNSQRRSALRNLTTTVN